MLDATIRDTALRARRRSRRRHRRSPGCESTSSLTQADRLQVGARAPALEIPPDLTTPQYDDRYTVTHRRRGSPRRGHAPAQRRRHRRQRDARCAASSRAGNERWLVVKATPEKAWNTMRKFWTDTGFVLAVEQPTLGVMETDWAENRAEMPQRLSCASTLGKFVDVFYRQLQARQVPHAHRARHRARHGRDLHLPSRHGAGADDDDRQRARRRHSSWAVMPPDPEPRGRDAGRG